MLIKNTATRFGAVSIFLHWLMALLIIGLLALGLYMSDLPVSAEKLKFFRWHKEFGLLVLMLVTFRVGWRFVNISPVLPTDMPKLQKLAAHSVHSALYLLMFAMPLTGWTLTSAAGLAPSFFGWFVLPPLVAANDNVLHLFEQIHSFLGYGFIALIGVHTGAALQHHFIVKDDILRRMLP